WCTGCGPGCVEFKLLNMLQAERGSRLQVIGVADDYHEDVVAYAESAEFNYPILIGRDDAIAAVESAGAEFLGLPITMVITPDGQLVKTHYGEIVAEDLAAIVAVLEQLDAGELDLAGAREALGRI